MSEWRGIEEEAREHLRQSERTAHVSTQPSPLTRLVELLCRAQEAATASVERDKGPVLRARRLLLATDQKPRDDPDLDGTDGAHPAWWRGNDAGVDGACMRIEEALDGRSLKGFVGYARLERLRRRVAALRGGAAELSFAALRAANASRCASSYHPIEEWSLSDWLTATTGELGELAGAIKNLRRKEAEGQSSHEIKPVERQELAYEAADVVIYLDLLCERAGIDLGEAVREKFNIVSDRVESDIKL